MKFIYPTIVWSALASLFRTGKRNALNEMTALEGSRESVLCWCTYAKTFHRVHTWVRGPWIEIYKGHVIAKNSKSAGMVSWVWAKPLVMLDSLCLIRFLLMPEIIEIWSNLNKRSFIFREIALSSWKPYELEKNLQVERPGSMNFCVEACVE